MFDHVCTCAPAKTLIRISTCDSPEPLQITHGGVSLQRSCMFSNKLLSFMLNLGCKNKVRSFTHVSQWSPTSSSPDTLLIPLSSFLSSSWCPRPPPIFNRPTLATTVINLPCTDYQFCQCIEPWTIFSYTVFTLTRSYGPGVCLKASLPHRPNILKATTPLKALGQRRRSAPRLQCNATCRAQLQTPHMWTGKRWVGHGHRLRVWHLCLPSQQSMHKYPQFHFATAKLTWHKAWHFQFLYEAFASVPWNNMKQELSQVFRLVLLPNLDHTGQLWNSVWSEDCCLILGCDTSCYSSTPRS